MNATDLTPHFPEPQGHFDPDDRLSIYVVAMLNRDVLIRTLAANEPDVPLSVLEETLDATTDKAFLLPSNENKLGFIPFSGGDPTEDLCKHLYTRTKGQLRTYIRQRSYQADMPDETMLAIVPDQTDFVTKIEQREMLADLATNAPEVMEYAVARANGTTEREFTANGVSNRQRSRHHKRLHAIREDWRSLAPVALFLRLIHGPRGEEAMTAAGGAGAGTAATVGGGAIAAKVGAVCAAGALCAGGVVGVVKHRDSEKPNKPVAVTKTTQAPQKLYTPIPKSTSSSRQTKQKKAASAARKHTDARKRAASRRQAAAVDNEFGVETGSSGSEYSSSSSSSSGSDSTTSSNSPEFGVEAGP